MPGMVNGHGRKKRSVDRPLGLDLYEPSLGLCLVERTYVVRSKRRHGT